MLQVSFIFHSLGDSVRPSFCLCLLWPLIAFYDDFIFSSLPGFSACSSWLIGNSNPDINCDCSLFNSPTLRKGCENFFSLKWSNPTVVYEEVSCPRELADLHCAFPYATEGNMPDTCANN